MIRPGHSAFARMPLAPYSTAAALVNAITPAFAALYTLVGMSDALSPPIDDQLTIDPPPFPRMARMPCFVPSSTPRRSTSMMRSYSAIVILCTGSAPPMPATFSTASTRPKASSAAANIASTWSSCVTSTRKGTTASPSEDAVSSSRPLMSAASTRAPSRTNTCDDDLPIPDPAPVITATLPSSSPMVLLQSFDCG